MHWAGSWAWGVPVIVFTVMVHSFALFSMRHRMVAALAKFYDDDKFKLPFALVIGAIVLIATLLLAIEAGLWAYLYVAIGALRDVPSAMLYSLESMTTFGHVDFYLTPRWQFLGALEALNGVILIGLTTAFIFSVLRSAELHQRAQKNPT